MLVKKSSVLVLHSWLVHVLDINLSDLAFDPLFNFQRVSHLAERKLEDVRLSLLETTHHGDRSICSHSPIHVLTTSPLPETLSLSTTPILPQTISPSFALSQTPSLPSTPTYRNPNTPFLHVPEALSLNSTPLFTGSQTPSPPYTPSFPSTPFLPETPPDLSPSTPLLPISPTLSHHHRSLPHFQVLHDVHCTFSRAPIL